ncbi:MAG: hypothetical protein KDA96_07945 [Planctomycetaceae bacterium]|nr:hypothetical protein [Planctomycetaceae bacterium]
MAVATDYSYMKDSGGTPRFSQAFAFKHILNGVDSANNDFLAEAKPLKNGQRIDGMTNTDCAYVQAMNRFNTSGVTAAYVTILEPVSHAPRPLREKLKSGSSQYTLQVERGWKFERIENNSKGPNYTKYEAVLVAQFGSRRVAVLSCMNQAGVVDHWDQTQNQTWFS